MGLDVLNLVDIRGESNYELAMRLQTSVANGNGEFYTDLNGFQASNSSVDCFSVKTVKLLKLTPRERLIWYQ